MIANGITVSRILLSFAMIVFPPSSVPFAVLYVLCGVTDVLDGFLARKLHTESKMGERLDSIADLFFAVVYAVKILPVLCLPVWIWIWTAFIAAVKIWGILQRGKKERRFYIAHSFANKLTGVFIFLLPMTIHLFDVGHSAAVVCTVATVAVTEELFRLNGARYLSNSFAEHPARRQDFCLGSGRGFLHFWAISILLCKSRFFAGIVPELCSESC